MPGPGASLASSALDLDVGRDLVHLVEAAPDDPHVVFDDALPELAELALDLGLDALEERRLVHPLVLAASGAHWKKAPMKATPCMR